MGTDRVNMKWSKVLAECFLFLRTNVLEILIAKDHNTSLSQKQGKFVLLGISQLRQL